MKKFKHLLVKFAANLRPDILLVDSVPGKMLDIERLVLLDVIRNSQMLRGQARVWFLIFRKNCDWSCQHQT